MHLTVPAENGCRQAEPPRRAGAASNTQVSRAEARKFGITEAAFAKANPDNDGTLDISEFLAALVAQAKSRVMRQPAPPGRCCLPGSATTGPGSRRGGSTCWVARPPRPERARSEDVAGPGGLASGVHTNNAGAAPEPPWRDAMAAAATTVLRPSTKRSVRGACTSRGKEI